MEAAKELEASKLVNEATKAFVSSVVEDSENRGATVVDSENRDDLVDPSNFSVSPQPFPVAVAQVQCHP